MCHFQTIDPFHPQHRARGLLSYAVVGRQKLFSHVATTLVSALVCFAAHAQSTNICNGFGEIAVSGFSVANPYPSSINVSGLTGVVSSISVAFDNFSSSDPQYVRALLIGPSGESVVLMRDAGGTSTVNALSLLFATNGSPMGSGVLQSGTYTPITASSASFPSPAPASPYGTSFSPFGGTAPNGTWRLFVYHSSTSLPPTTTSIDQWCLNITTGQPTYSVGGSVTGLSAGALTLEMNDSAQTQTLSSNGAYSFATPLSTGQGYRVFVRAHPLGPPIQTCTVQNGVGAIGTSNIANVNVSCVNGARLAFDIDGDGRVLPTTDGVLLLRWQLGLRGNALASGALAPTATRTDPTMIANHIQDVVASELP